MRYKQKLFKTINLFGITSPEAIKNNFKIEKALNIQEDLKNKNIIGSAKPIEERTQIALGFYELLKAVSARYSIALKELASK